MENRQVTDDTSKPFINYMLSKRAFFSFYFVDSLATIGYLHLLANLKQEALFNTNLALFIIFIIIAPLSWFFLTKIVAELNSLFEITKHVHQNTADGAHNKFSDIFASELEFNKYRERIIDILSNKKEKYYVITVGIIFTIFAFVLADFQNGFLQQMVASQNVFLYASEYILYWSIVALFLSIFTSGLLVAINYLRILINIRSKIETFHISCILGNFDEESTESAQQDLLTIRLGILHLSLRRLKMGLHQLDNFLFSSSTKIIIIGTFASAGGIAYYFLTNQVVPGWYLICSFLSLTGVFTLIIGNLIIWRIWSISKNKTVTKFDEVCSKLTKKHSNIWSEYANSDKEIENQLDTIRNIEEKISHINYTTSPQMIIRIFSALFLAFGPLIIELILRYI